AGAVQAEQRGEARLRDGQADVLQRLARPIGVADAVHGNCRRQIRRGTNGRIGERVGAHLGDTTTPHGSRPTWIDFTTSRAAVSITEMSLESPLVVSRYFWSGVNAICQTRCPTNRYFRTLCSFASITATRFAGPRATKPV